MTVTAKKVLGLLLFVWLLAACGGDDSAMTATDEGEPAMAEALEDEENSNAARTSSDAFDGDSESNEAAAGGANGFTPAFGGLITAEQAAPLQGTAWLIDEIDSEPHTAAISFAWRADEGVVAWFRDECTDGGFTASNDVRGSWRIVNDDPPPNCSSPLWAIFSDGAIVELNLVNDELLTVTSPGGELTATHWQSVSVHDEPIIVEFQ